jgi:protein-tyrosine-phosphatase
MAATCGPASSLPRWIQFFRLWKAFHHLAIRVMEEIGIDISGHRSKHLEEFLDLKVHTVVTVCGYASQPSVSDISRDGETVPLRL